MQANRVAELHSGDQVKWNDPDNGLCSRIVTIGSIEVNGTVVHITSIEGDELECFARELS